MLLNVTESGHTNMKNLQGIHEKGRRQRFENLTQIVLLEDRVL